MNVPEFATRATYLVLALGSLAAGLWLIVEPLGASGVLHLHAGDTDGSEGSVLRRLGAGYLCAALALAGCVLAAGMRRALHLGALLFLGILAAVEAGELAAAGIPALDWPATSPLALLPPLVLALMLLPLPSLPALPARTADAGGTESGIVKWFDSRKGFGFITRSNGEELFVHYRSISAAHGGGKALRDGQPVRFRVGQGKKGPQAEDVVPVSKKA